MSLIKSCSKNRLSEVFEGKNVVIVGGAPSSLKNKIGYIDSFDVVVRVNNYKLFPQTGKRTDVFYSYFGGAIKKTVQELKRDGVYLCICKCPNEKVIESEWHRRHGKMNGVDFRYIYRGRKEFWFCDTYVPSIDEFAETFNLLDKHIPTSGFGAIYDVLKHSPKSLYITGFDFFSSGLHNVDERWAKLNAADPIGHRPDLELNWLKNNIGNYPIILDETLKAMVKNDK